MCYETSCNKKLLLKNEFYFTVEWKPLKKQLCLLIEENLDQGKPLERSFPVFILLSCFILFFCDLGKWRMLEQRRDRVYFKQYPSPPPLFFKDLPSFLRFFSPVVI